MKKNGSSDKGEPRFKKRAQTQDGPIAKVKLGKKVVLKMSSLRMSLVEIGIMVSVYWVPGVSTVVVRKDTR